MQHILTGKRVTGSARDRRSSLPLFTHRFRPLEPLLQVAQHVSQGMPMEHTMHMSQMSATEGIQNGLSQSTQMYDHSQPSQGEFHALQVALGQALPHPTAPSVSEVDEKKKKGAAYTATNDKELREMLTRNDGRVLKEVAQEVIATERTPKAEKSKQLFAMLWCVTQYYVYLNHD